MKLFATLICVFLLNIASAQLTGKLDKGPGVNKYEQVHGFLKNIGQVKDIKNQPANTILYTAVVGDKKIAITTYGLAYLSFKLKKVYRQAANGQYANSGKKLASPGKDSITRKIFDLQRTDVVLEGANINAANINEEDYYDGAASYNYYISTYQAGNVTPCKKLTINNIYPGIAWVLYIKRDEAGAEYFTYDFVIAPGANMYNIRLRYSRDVNVKTNSADGSLNITGKLLSIKESAPVSYYKKSHQPVNVNYAVTGNNVSFKTEGSISDTLVIDPDVFWATYISSTEPDIEYRDVIGNDIETDKAGNIFVLFTVGAGVPFPTEDPGNGTYYAGYDTPPAVSMAIMKFSAGGVLLWSTFYGDNNTAGNLLSVNTNGDVYALGIPGTIPLKDNGGYYDTVYRGHFITRFTNDGKLLWSTYMSAGDVAHDMICDSRGSVFIAGWSNQDALPIISPNSEAYTVPKPAFGQAHTLFIMEVNSKNNLVWSTRVEGDDDDDGNAMVCADNNGNVYLGGSGRSDNYPLVNGGGYFNDSIDAYRNFVTKFNPNRKMIWSTIIPGISFSDFDCDENGNLYVATSRAVFKFDSKTNLLWQRSLNFNRLYYYSRLVYDRSHQQVMLYGLLNDLIYGWPGVNTTCNNTFYYDGTQPAQFGPNGPFFVTYTNNGDCIYASMSDMPYNNYYGDFTVDGDGNPTYLFYAIFNPPAIPVLTNPGNGAFYQPKKNAQANSAFILKLTSTGISAQASISPPPGCGCTGVAEVTVNCAQAPLQYTWSNGNTTSKATGLCPGSYWVQITDASKQTKRLNVYIPQPTNSIKSISYGARPENCDLKNGSITLTGVTGGTSPYLFNIDSDVYNSKQSFSQLSSSIPHIIGVKDNNGCVFFDTLTIENIPAPGKVCTSATVTSCNKADGIIVIDSVKSAAAPFLYSIDGGGYSAKNIVITLASGSHTLLVKDSAGCSLDTVITVGMATPPGTASINIFPDHCNSNIGGFEVTNVQGGTAPYTYSLNDTQYAGTTTWQQMNAGTYQLYVKDNKGCILKKDSITITNTPGPSKVLFTLKNAVCGLQYGNVQVDSVYGGVAPYVFSIDGSLYSAANYIDKIYAGNHSLNAKDYYGCTYSDSFTIKYVASPAIKVIAPDTALCYGTDVNVILQTSNNNLVYSIRWNIPGLVNYGGNINMQADATAIAVVTDVNNCIITDTALLKVKACNTPDKCLYFPTAFTPNGDALNDFAGPLINGCRVTKLHFSIYNRFGEMVFQSSSVNNKWDGRFKAMNQPAGTYVYSCTFTGDDGINRLLKGTLVLIR